MFKQIAVAAVVVGERLRIIDEVKVLELMQSYEEIGVINPISVDKDLVLIAGAHRLEAARNLGWTTIEAKIFSQEDLQRELIEIDENLIRNELCYVGEAEHIQKREIILTSLGKRRQRGSNQYADDEGTISTDELASRLGTSNKMYRLKRQIGDLLPEVRNAIRGTHYAKRNLNDLVHLSRMPILVQKRVAEMSINDPRQTLKFHIDAAYLEVKTDRFKQQLVVELKEKWGTPYSVMKFTRETHPLCLICQQVSKFSDCIVTKSVISSAGMPNYSGFPDHSLFLLEYFVRKPKSRVLDNFMGKGTNLMAGLWMDMEMHGFDLNPRLVDRVQEVADEHFPDGELHLYNEDGISMAPLKDEKGTFDAIITDPPYLNCPDIYTDNKNDLSNMKQPQWEEKMAEAFRQYYRLIKGSSVKDKTFYPLMMRMSADPTEEAWTNAMGEAINRQPKIKRTGDSVTGHRVTEEYQFHPVIMKMNASRRAETGMVSMDFILARIAEQEGFTLWDRTFNTLAPSSVSVSTLRNYDFHYTHKNWETTLIWIKQ